MDSQYTSLFLGFIAELLLFKGGAVLKNSNVGPSLLDRVWWREERQLAGLKDPSVRAEG